MDYLFFYINSMPYLLTKRTGREEKMRYNSYNYYDIMQWPAHVVVR